MKRLKQLRESFHLTQAQLAKELHTTQQTIARWESGKSQPDITALKDLALFFQTSVDDLLEYAKTGKRIRSTSYWIGEKEREGFWGHIGVKVGQNASVWFPVTAHIAHWVEQALLELGNTREWVLFPTLVNQYVAIQPALLSEVTILDDDGDCPQEDWKLTYPYEGLPLELYKGFDEIGFSDLLEEDMRTVTRLYSKKQQTKLSKEEATRYHQSLQKCKRVLENASEHFIVVLLCHFLEEGLTDNKKYAHYMYDVNVYLADGSQRCFMDREEFLLENLDKLEMEPNYIPMLRFESALEAPVFIPTCKIAMITMPYLTILKTEKRREEELKKDAQ